MSYTNRYTTKWNNWIEEAIFNEHINCYEYKDFYNFKGVGSGGFGTVYRANWKDSHNIYALKSLKDSEAKKFVDELKIQRKVNVHDNIIRFYGITRVDQNYYMLVMEYADGASAVSCLHNLGIIHRDLHSNNILQGLRETPIPNTPEDYKRIYTDCWKYEPDDRPDIREVVNRLVEVINNNSSHSSRNNSSPSSRNNSSLSSRNNLSQTFKQKGSKSKKDIVDGIAALPYKIYDKRIATEVDTKMAYNFYERAVGGDDGLNVVQYNLGVICENELRDKVKAAYWYRKSAEQGNHEARESFNRIRNDPHSSNVVPSITVERAELLSRLFGFYK
ncbi:unnamed protein product [Rhizophagus irregularis]|nr:unnamed protein product [Rhizophagus irregularis]